MPYVIVNPQVFTQAFTGARAGMLAAKKLLVSSNPADYAAVNAAAGMWAQEVDTQWANAASADALTIGTFYQDSKAFWWNRAPQSITPTQCAQEVAAIVAAITSAIALYAANGWTNPPWGGAGGGSGDVPNTPPMSVGYVLTSTNNTAGSLSPLVSSDWEPSGGFSITGFSKNHGSVFELGNADVQPTFAASYSELPDSASIAYTQQPASPLTLLTPFTAGQILETFTFTVNGATVTYTLTAIKGAVTKNSVITNTAAEPLLFEVAATGSILATQGFLDTMRAANGAFLRTSMGGSYGLMQTVGAGQQFAFAAPTGFTLNTVLDPSGFPITPVTVGAVAGYTNPYGTVIPMTLYTFGGVGIGLISPSGFTVS